MPKPEHLPNNWAQRSHHQTDPNWVNESVNQERAEPGNKNRHEEQQKTQQAKQGVFPNTSYRKPQEKGRQHSGEGTRSHRKQSTNEQ
jgi:hypothetical protein